MVKNSPKLIIRRASDGNAVINIPLNNYLLLLKSELYEQMKPQEFLDRESEWSLFSFSTKWCMDKNLYQDQRLDDPGQQYGYVR